MHYSLKNPLKEMNMKRRLMLALAIVLAIAFTSLGQGLKNKSVRTTGQDQKGDSLAATLIEKEKALWEAVKNKKFDEFRSRLASDYKAVYTDGMKNLDQEVESVKQGDLKSYALTDTSVKLIDKDAALVTYKTTVQGSAGGQDFSGTYNTASIWVKRQGKWVGVFHTEMKAQ